MNVGRTWIRVMLICGAFAGVAASLDILGWKFNLFTNDIQTSQIGFYGIAVALLGRNTAGGTVAAALLFGALLTGTSSRNLNLSIDPTLVQYLTFMIEGIIVLLVSTDVITLRLLKGGRRIGVAFKRRPRDEAPAGQGGTGVHRERRHDRHSTPARRDGEAGRRRGRRPRRARVGDHDPPDRGSRRGAVDRARRSRCWPAHGRSTAASARSGSRRSWSPWSRSPVPSRRRNSSVATLESVFTWSALVAATLRYATPLLFAALGGVISERSGVINIGLEGMMLMGCFWGIYGADLLGSWVWGLVVAMIAGGLLALLHAFFSIHLRANQIVSGTGINFLALGITGYFLEYHYGPNGTPLNISQVPERQAAADPARRVLRGGVRRREPDDLDRAGARAGADLLPVPDTWGLRLRSVGEKPRAADTVGLPVLRIRYVAVVVSGMLAALGGAYLSVGFVGSFSNNMTDGRGFIALAAMIFGKWKPWGALWACCCSGSEMRCPTGSPRPTRRSGRCSRRCRTCSP